MDITEVYCSRGNLLLLGPRAKFGQISFVVNDIREKKLNFV